jgi:hypothetical protein
VPPPTVSRLSALLLFTLVLACGGGGSHTAAPPPAPTDPGSGFDSLTAFTPDSGPAGTPVTLRGPALTGVTQVTFGGIPAIVFTVVDAGAVTAEVPPLAASGPILVKTPATTYQSATDFTVTGAPPPGPDDPSLISFTPIAGVPGTDVTLQGSGLTLVARVLFGGIAAQHFTVTSDSQIVATVPAGAVTGPITVITPSGQGSSSNPFTVLPAP